MGLYEKEGMGFFSIYRKENKEIRKQRKSERERERERGSVSSSQMSAAAAWSSALVSGTPLPFKRPALFARPTSLSGSVPRHPSISSLK